MNNPTDYDVEWDIIETILQRAEAVNSSFKEALWAAAVTRWFDEKLLSFLLNRGDNYSDGSFEWLVQRPFIEPYNLAELDNPLPRYTLHNRTRVPLLSLLRKEDMNHFYFLNQRAWRYHKNKLDTLQHNMTEWADEETCRFEMVYHWLSFDGEEAFAEVEDLLAGFDEAYNPAAYERLLSLVDERRDYLSSEKQYWLQFYKGRLLTINQKWQMSLQMLEPLSTADLPPLLEASLYQALGDIHRALGRWERAIELYGKVIDYHKKHEDTGGEFTTLVIAQLNCDLGKVKLLQGKWDLAQKQFHEALNIFQKFSFKLDEGKTLILLSQTNRYKGDWKRAVKFGEKALACFRTSDFGQRTRLHGEAEARSVLGNAYQMQGKWQSARRQYKIAKDLFASLGDRYAETVVMVNLGEWSLRRGRVDKSLDILRTTLDLATELEDIELQSAIQILLGQSFKAAGQWEEAERWYLLSLDSSRKLNRELKVGEILSELAELYRMQGEWQKAAQIYHETTEVYLAM